MARDTNGTQTVKKPHGTVMKVPIQSGNVSKRETIEESTVSARTGILSANTMVLMPHSVKAQQGIMKADVIRSNKFVLS